MESNLKSPAALFAKDELKPYLGKKVFLLSTTEGCATNLLENKAYRKQYNELGYESVSDAKSADVILVNTCAYNQEMENRAVKIISEFKNKYPGKELVMAGCLPKINPKRVKNFFDGTVIKQTPKTELFSNQHEFDKSDFKRLSKKHRLVLFLRPVYFWIEDKLKYRLQPLHNLLETVIVNEEYHLLTVSSGCIGKCTFCAIKHAKGSLRSRPFQVIENEFISAIEKGKKKFWLLGDDIGCWGQDIQSNIAQLLSGLLSHRDDFSLVLNYLDPHFLCKYPEPLMELLSDPRIIGINMPIQSGSEKVLRAMAREYDPNVVYSLLRQIKIRNPGLAIKTNIMVGFPGETNRDFFASLWSVFKFDAILGIAFTARPHTPAEKYSNQIPVSIRKMRLMLLNLFILFQHLRVTFRSFFRGARIHSEQGRSSRLLENW